MPGTIGHLGRRFFEVLGTRPLDATERATVESWLPPALASIFFDQPTPDQRHGYDAGLATLAAGAESVAVVAAAMHDSGKRHSSLGVVGRVTASAMIKLGLPLTRRMTLYRDHGSLAAHELAAAEAPTLVVDFALHHHGTRPSSISAPTWEILVQADQPKPVKRGGTDISSAAK